MSNDSDSQMEVGQSDEFERLKGQTKSESLFPKPPLVNPKTNKRQDGRSPKDVRPIYVQTGVRDGAKGSAYVEMGTTKVLCIVSGPKDLPKKMDLSSTGIISVDVQLVGGKMSEKDVILIKECMEAVVILEKFPKCLLEIFLTIMEDGGSSIAASICAAGLALVDSGVPIYDTPVGSTLLYDGKDFYLDPSKSELDSVDLTDSEKNDSGGGIVTMGYLPTREQICLFTMEGKMDAEVLASAMDSLTNVNLKVFAVIRHHSMELMKEFKETKSKVNK
ncbi:unnamed protein product [Orchesella dallaii]|uniref:Exoribonuclease phosphorolytic domain-containing protein n=1 Tax=Orchesella dallaii TaxID=48710 RepID=A0ABP1QPJ7_9HEXA